MKKILIGILGGVVIFGSGMFVGRFNSVKKETFRNLDAEYKKTVQEVNDLKTEIKKLKEETKKDEKNKDEESSENSSTENKITVSSKNNKVENSQTHKQKESLNANNNQSYEKTKNNNVEVKKENNSAEIHKPLENNNTVGNINNQPGNNQFGGLPPSDLDSGKADNSGTEPGIPPDASFKIEID